MFYLRDGGELRARSYALAASRPSLGADGGLDYQSGLPYFTIDPATGKLNAAGHQGSPRLSKPRSEWNSSVRVATWKEEGAWMARLDLPLDAVRQVLGGAPGSIGRLPLLAAFCVYLVAMILTVVPTSLLLQWLTRPLLARRLRSLQAYYELPSGR